MTHHGQDNGRLRFGTVYAAPLWRFARSRRFAAQAATLTGYDLAHAGEVSWNDQA